MRQRSLKNQHRMLEVLLERFDAVDVTGQGLERARAYAKWIEADKFIDRIVSRIEVDKNDCWLWTGSISDGGYAVLSVRHENRFVHRLMYLLLAGDIPDGLHIDHLCRVRRCVNPAHLEPVTRRENILRGVGITAQNARKTHCKHGHEFTEDNVERITRPNGSVIRRCKRCNREETISRRAWLKARREGLAGLEQERSPELRGATTAPRSAGAANVHGSSGPRSNPASPVAIPLFTEEEAA